MVTIAFQPALARARAALERGRHADAIGILTQALKVVRPQARRRARPALHARRSLAHGRRRRAGVGDAWTAARIARDDLPPALLSTLWRLHGRIAFAKGDQSRAIALLGRALRHAEQAHDSEAIGLAHYELGLCYKQVGDTAIVREHIAKAAPALHAAGQSALSRAAALAVWRRARAGRPHRGSHRRAAAGRAACGVGAGAGCARHHLEQPGERRADSASS